MSIRVSSPPPDRAQDCGSKLSEVVTAVKTLSAERVQSVTREVERLTKTIEACAEFLEQFGEKGFLSRMMNGELDAKKFAELDRRLAAHSTELGSALDLQNLAMQERIFSQMEQLASLVADQEKDASKVAALCSGLDGDELRSELDVIQEKLDEIKRGQDEVKAMLEHKVSTEQGRALARQDKQRAMAKFEIALDAIEHAPFARGGYSIVHIAEFHGEQVLLKKLPLVGLTALQREKLFRDFSSELAVMVEMRSPRVVSVFGVVTVDPTFFGLVLEFCPGGDLRARLDDESATIEDPLKRLWLSDIAMGMDYIYVRDIEHRDLKSMNVLLDANDRAKVTDFGLAKSETLVTHTAGSTKGGAAGTPAYMAPELLMSNTFTEKSDVCVSLPKKLTRRLENENPRAPPQVLVRHHYVGGPDARASVSGDGADADLDASVCAGRAAARARRARDVRCRRTDDALLGARAERAPGL